jgi:predicted transglutaminase-like cysteine proteinase
MELKKIKKILCGCSSCPEFVSNLVLKSEADKLLQEIADQESQINDLIKEYVKPDIRAEAYNSKWTKNELVYRAQGKIDRDPRTLIPAQSHILQPLIKKFTGTDDEKALAILKWVYRNIIYDEDVDTHNVSEFWQHPEETFQTKIGDCEDGALLVKALCNLAGIPDYKVKICAGWVKTDSGRGGHCYPIYLRDDDTWCILDWCYYYDSKPINERIEHKVDLRYQDIWWTFTQEFTFAQTSTALSGNEFKKVITSIPTVLTSSQYKSLKERRRKNEQDKLEKKI